VSKAYNLFAGEEPYNCSKRGTVVIDKNGKISFWQEQPMREPRKVSDLTKAVIAEAFEERANEGGSAV
jgi:peroxiredoxin